MCKLTILCDWLVTESRDRYFNTIPQKSGMVEALFGFKSTQQKKFNLLWWILLKPVLQHEKSRQINVGTLYCTMTLCDIELKRKARSNGWMDGYQYQPLLIWCFQIVIPLLFVKYPLRWPVSFVCCFSFCFPPSAISAVPPCPVGSSCLPFPPSETAQAPESPH